MVMNILCALGGIIVGYGFRAWIAVKFPKAAAAVDKGVDRLDD